MKYNTGLKISCGKIIFKNIATSKKNTKENEINETKNVNQGWNNEINHIN